MERDSNYIKDIENYFLQHAGEGIMLSSMDYSLILEWKNKDIPKEVVFKGINKAFQEWKAKEGQGTRSARTLKRCEEYIKKSIAEFSPIIGIAKKARENVDSDIDSEIVLARLNSYINSEQDEIIKNYYIDMKDRLLSHTKSGDENFLTVASLVEEEAINNFYDNLQASDKEQIAKDARDMVGGRARHMTQDALAESVLSFQNEIIINKYKLKSLLSDEEHNG